MARTSPFLTVWPTATVADLTGHVRVLLPAALLDELLDELLAALELELLPAAVPAELTTSGVAPNLRP